MYGFWYIKHDRYSFLSLWAILCSFTSLTTQKIRFWKKEKNSWRDYHFTNEFHKWKSYDAWFLRYGVQQIFLSLWTIFCPFTPTEVYHKWQSYDIRFLRYQLQQTGFFCVLGPFFALLPLTAKKWKYKKKLKTWKKCLEISSFHQVYQKSWS